MAKRSRIRNLLDDETTKKLCSVEHILATHRPNAIRDAIIVHDDIQNNAVMEPDTRLRAANNLLGLVKKEKVEQTVSHTFPQGIRIKFE